MDLVEETIGNKDVAMAIFNTYTFFHPFVDFALLVRFNLCEAPVLMHHCIAETRKYFQPLPCLIVFT